VYKDSPFDISHYLFLNVRRHLDGVDDDDDLANPGRDKGLGVVVVG